MKTNQELNAIMTEVEAVNRKLEDLTENELEQVAGGYWDDCVSSGCPNYGHVRQCIKAKGMRQCPMGHKITD